MPNKQAEVKNFLSLNKVNVFGLLETKIAASSMNKVLPMFSSTWSICTNSSTHKGGRVWLLWNPLVIDVTIKWVDAQCIVADVWDKGQQRVVQLIMVYAFNKIHERTRLWQVICQFNQFHGPWIVCGDFNNVLHTNERMGADVSLQEIAPFGDCLRSCGLNDLSSQGAFFTWSNKQTGVDRVCSRIDRVVVNDMFLQEFPSAFAHFLPEGLYDHCPCVIRLVMDNNSRTPRFRYFNMWGLAAEFLETVQTTWSDVVYGTRMYQVVTKLRGLKLKLKALNRDSFSNVEGNAEVAIKALKDIQVKIQLAPNDAGLLLIEQQLQESAKVLSIARYSFLRQKSKAHWIEMGDSNTAYFHSVIKARRAQNRVVSIRDIHGIVHESPDGIQQAFTEYYKTILGSTSKVQPVHLLTVKQGLTVQEEDWPRLVAVPTKEEIKTELFSIPDDKAPGPDGYTSKFFKDSWSVIGDDICLAVQDFFKTGRLLKQLNSTLLTLIPKVAVPVSVTEFRPIACCNVLSKCISKILCNRMNVVLPVIISPTQSAFVKGRQIVENVLLCQDLIRLYTRKSCSPRCLLKIDLRKAYDSVEWQFVEDMLRALNFPEHFIRLIMVSVRSPWYSLTINGDCFGYFKGERGLRQGDPLSPLLFTVCMEYLSRILLVVSKKEGFHHHPLCGRLQLTHLCFADDLLLFSRGDESSVRLLLCGFHTFSVASGLVMNNAKSDLYCNGIPDLVLQRILRMSGFKRGSLPFKYLGVPISSRRITSKDCYVLCERICARIRGWGARRLSYAGRLTLVNSVLNSVHTYWASIFLLPASVIQRVIALCRNYLWEGCEEFHRAPLVSWDKVCVEKKYGGLGVTHCQRWNVAALGKYVWWLANKKDHLWVRWVNHIYLKGVDWMLYEPNSSSSWAWRQICKVREIMRPGYSRGTWCSASGEYTISDGYTWLSGQQTAVNWAFAVWNRFNIPKWSFIAWLARLQRLLTMDRLAKWGLHLDDGCFLCGVQKETSSHLFFECLYSSQCVKEVACWMLIQFAGDQWKLVHQRRSLSKLQRAVCAATLNGLIYSIWFQRNKCRLEGRLLLPRVVAGQVIRSVVLRIDALHLCNVSRRDEIWLSRLRRTAIART